MLKEIVGESSNLEAQATMNIMTAVDDNSRLEVIDTFENLGIMTNNAGFEMKYKNTTFQITVVEK